MRSLVKVLLRQDGFVPVSANVRTSRFGSDYGGWEVATDALSNLSVVYSCGVGEDISFDLALIDRFGLTVHAFDPTPRSREWIRTHDLPPCFVMHGVGIADVDGELSFYPPRNPGHVSHSILSPRSSSPAAIRLPVKTIRSIMTELGHDRIDILKMDIEGAEYRVIHALFSSTIRPRQILVEFHHRFRGVDFAKTRQAVEQLQQMGYDLFSVSRSRQEYGFIHAGA